MTILEEILGLLSGSPELHAYLLARPEQLQTTDYADIITGVSLFLLFVSLGVSQGFTTVVLAHITFCTPYVVLSVMPRLKKMNQNVYEAALDLGATPGTP